MLNANTNALVKTNAKTNLAREYQRWTRNTEDPLKMQDADALVSRLAAQLSPDQILAVEMRDPHPLRVIGSRR